ncbi:MAG: UDP-glucose 4-epimerase GalE [Gammaproteobacteria bacterium]|nr:UDP-glucose 4-epimerase GalE [Gammaproteobacteria bacterium]
MKVLITGGAGFIGSTIASACADAGIEPIILDDLSAGLRSFAERFTFYEGDYGDPQCVRQVLHEHPDLDAVVHCAASIVVPESVQEPLRYYHNNVSKLTVFLEELLQGGCRRVLFSSTAAMYEPGPAFMVDERSAINPTSPYAASKFMVERILADVAAVTDLRVISLRYFNPIGADPQLRTGLQVEHPSHALGRLLAARTGTGEFTVTGTEWPTRDGSGLRDYIHVWDLALAHVAALRGFDDVMKGQTTAPGYDVINLGTGAGTTVFELVDAFQEVTGAPLAVRTGPPRPGDVVGCYTSAEKAHQVLGWRTTLSIAQGIADALAWSALLPDALREPRNRGVATTAIPPITGDRTTDAHAPN